MSHEYIVRVDGCAQEQFSSLKGARQYVRSFIEHCPQFAGEGRDYSIIRCAGEVWPVVESGRVLYAGNGRWQTPRHRSGCWRNRERRALRRILGELPAGNTTTGCAFNTQRAE